MANTARTGTIMYSGITTTTDSDVLTLTGPSPNKPSGGGIGRLNVRNRHASLVLYVRTDGTSPTAAAGDGVTVIPPATAVDVPVRTVTTGTVEVRLISTAACDYNVTAFKS